MTPTSKLALGKGKKLLLVLGLTSAAASTWAQSPESVRPTALGVQTTETYHAWPLRAEADSEDFSDLAPLAQGLAGVQVLGLAEQTHGAREEFNTKLRLLKFLHQKLGFEVLQLESGFYDLGKISQAMARGESLDALAPGNVFYMYAKSAEGRRLLRYIDQTQGSAKPLLLAGTDSQHSGEWSARTLLTGLQEALRKADAGHLAQGEAWQGLSRLSAALLAMQRLAPPAAEQQSFFAHTQLLRDALCALPDAQPSVESPAWWCRVVLSLLAQARSVWSDGADYQRDNVMGANSIWLTDQMFKGRKTVIWAHIVHLARGFERSPQHLQAGEVMHRHWGERYKVIHFSAGEGQILDFVTLQPQTLPALRAGSLEAQLMAKQTQQALLIQAKKQPLQMPQYAFDYQYRATETAMREAQLGRNWDWLIFFPKVHPVQMVR